MDASHFYTHTLKDQRIARILTAAIDSVDPARLIREHLSDIPKADRIYALGIGKAAQRMTEALADSIPLNDSLVIVKHASSGTVKLGRVIEGGHPIPDSRSLAAGRAALEFVSRLEEDDLLICLISGGGSALMTQPRQGISLTDLQVITAALLAGGAGIEEVNTVRRQLDDVKGGGLVKATKARLVSLILSDVLGNPLEAIASGPTSPDPTTREDAIAVLEKYGLKDRVLESAWKDASIQPSIFDRVQNFIVGDLGTAAQSAKRQAETEGFHSNIMDLHIHSEAREAGRLLAGQLALFAGKLQRPFCMIAGGETTVTIKGDGKGGRNQEMALAAVNELDKLKDIMLVTLATDGEDGPTDAAGAVVNEETRQRGERLGMFAADCLSRNDAYSYFAKLDDLIKPGPTGTNANDLYFLFGL